MPMLVRTFIVGAFSTNCYIFTCPKTKQSIMIDPGFDDPAEAENILSFIGSKPLSTLRKACLVSCGCLR
jgi:glyoxylase-like metal-dependent hydrolase (beta-lactamase superfamily II)